MDQSTDKKVEEIQQHIVFGISGKAQAGKDTLAEHIRDSLAPEIFDVHIIHMADELKRICRSMFGFTDHQLNTIEGKNSLSHLSWSDLPYRRDKSSFMKVREVLEEVGTTFFRGLDPDCHLNSVETRIKELLFQSTDRIPVFLVPDIRETNEISSILRMGGANIRLARNTENRQTPIETALDALEPEDFDYYIDNTHMTVQEKNQEGLDYFLSFVNRKLKTEK